MLTPPKVNRAHWPTKENRHFCCCIFCIFPAHAKNWPKWGQEDFFLLIQTLLTFWAERILILRMLFFWIFLVPNFWLGPGVGPPTWARRGPTHVGPAWAHPRSSVVIGVAHPMCTMLLASGLFIALHEPFHCQACTLAIGPPRKIGKILAFFGFFQPTQKMGREGPKWGREVCFPA